MMASMAPSPLQPDHRATDRADDAKRGTIAFIATPNFRENHQADFREFVLRHLYFLARSFDVLMTGGTYQEVVRIIGSIAPDTVSAAERSAMSDGAGFEIGCASSLNEFIATISREQAMREIKHSPLRKV